MKTHIFFIKDDTGFFEGLTPEDKAFYLSLDLDIDNYTKEAGAVKQFESLEQLAEFAGLIGKDGIILTIDKKLGLCLYVFNE